MIGGPNLLAQAQEDFSLPAVQIMCEKNKYHPEKNINGFVSFGSGVNKIITKETLKYLPSFLTEADCAYKHFHGTLEMRKQVCKLTNFNTDQVICQSNALCLVRLLFETFKSISFEGQFPAFDILASYTSASKVNNNSKAHFIFNYESLFNEEKIIEKANLQPHTFWILTNLGQKSFAPLIKNPPKNFFLIETFTFKINLECGVLYCKDAKWVDLSFNDCEIGSTSSLLNAAVFGDVEIENVSCADELKQAISWMMNLESKALTSTENIYLTIGGIGAYTNLNWCITKACSTICTDSPFYVGFHHLEEKGAVLRWKSKAEGTLLERIISAEQQGCSMYIINNPLNPTGQVYSPQDIDSICQWVQNYPHFHLLFDQMFLNSTHENVQIKSAIEYVNRLPNVHIARGFAKDFGLSGFKVGFAITSNKQFQQKLADLECISNPHPYVITQVTKMLKASNFGQNIYPECRKGLTKSAFSIECQLDKSKIRYIKPKGGCFFFLDVREYFVRHPDQTENKLWKRLLQAGLNVTMGLKFHALEAGYIRICPMIEQALTIEGLKRLDAVINRKQ